jgi:hypothetical protein
MFDKVRKTRRIQDGPRKSRSGSMLAFLLLTTLSFPAFAESFVGEWIATAEVPGGGVSEALIVQKSESGYSVAVKLLDSMPGIPEASPGLDIKIDGDRFSYTRTIGELKIVYAGVVSGDTFAGTVSMGGTEIPYTGVRRTDEN